MILCEFIFPLVSKRVHLFLINSYGMICDPRSPIAWKIAYCSPPLSSMGNITHFGKFSLEATTKWAWEAKQRRQRSCSSESESESESEGEGENGRQLGREWEGERMGLRDLGGKWVFIVWVFFFFFFNIIYMGRVWAGYA